MATITFKGSAIHTSGELPSTGSTAPDFKLTAGDLSDKGLADFTGQVKILNITPSLDTPVCAASARKFNEAVETLGNTVLLNISSDLPFAAARFCESEGLKSVVHLSTFRNPSFVKDYGVGIVDGPLAGLTCRAVLVLKGTNEIAYQELVPEIAQEPDYESALKAATAAE